MSFIFSFQNCGRYVSSIDSASTCPSHKLVVLENFKTGESLEYCIDNLDSESPYPEGHPPPAENEPAKYIPLSPIKKRLFTGPQKIFIAPVRAAGVTPSFTNTKLVNQITGNNGITVNTIFKDSTEGRLTISQAVIAPITDIPQRCGTDATQNATNPYLYAKQIVIDNPSSYGQPEDYLAFVTLFPDIGPCTGWAGGAANDGIWLYSGMSDSALISTLAHEIGHIMGLGHSGFVKLSNESNVTTGLCFPGVTCSIPGANNYYDYRDRSSVMSSTGSSTRLLNQHKESIGQLFPENVKLATPPLNSTSKYHLYARDIKNSLKKPQLIKVPIEYGFYLLSNGRNFIHLEYDPLPVGVNNSYTGVQVRYSSDFSGGSSMIATDSTKPITLKNIGDNFEDKINNIRIKLTALIKDNNYDIAEVEVSYIHPKGSSLIPKANSKIISVTAKDCDTLDIEFQSTSEDLSLTNIYYMDYFNRDKFGNPATTHCQKSQYLATGAYNTWKCTLTNPGHKRIISLNNEYVVQLSNSKMQHAISVPPSINCSY